MRGSRNLRPGGPGQSDKKSSDNFFFLVLSLFYRSQMVKDLGQSPIQSAQNLTACGWDNVYSTTTSFVLKSNPNIKCTKQNKNILKILHDYARTLGFRGWGYFL